MTKEYQKGNQKLVKEQTQNMCKVKIKAARLATALLAQTDNLQHNCTGR
jgi:hypothetical protein